MSESKSQLNGNEKKKKNNQTIFYFSYYIQDHIINHKKKRIFHRKIIIVYRFLKKNINETINKNKFYSNQVLLTFLITRASHIRFVQLTLILIFLFFFALTLCCHLNTLEMNYREMLIVFLPLKKNAIYVFIHKTVFLKFSLFATRTTQKNQIKLKLQMKEKNEGNKIIRSHSFIFGTLNIQ